MCGHFAFHCRNYYVQIVERYSLYASNRDISHFQFMSNSEFFPSRKEHHVFIPTIVMEAGKQIMKPAR